MRLGATRAAAAAVVWAPLAAALFVSPNSPCATYCGNVNTRTATDEMACNSTALSGTAAGAVWEQCIRCLLTSNFESGSRSDVQALTYNLRFNMETCLFNAPSEPCITSRACGPLAGAVDYQNMSTSVGAYDYCGTWSSDTASKCSVCLVELQDGNYLNNYLQILEAACEQQPANGSTVSVQGDPFSTNAVVIVTPQPTYATVPTPDYGPVSLGARVGIAFGGLALILAVAGFCIVCIGKRRRRAFLRDLERKHGANGWPHPSTRYGGAAGNGQDMFETPVSQKPLRGWESESPVSAATDGPYPRYFSPYSSTYNSPVTGPHQGPSGSTPVSATAGPGAGGHYHNWPAFPTQQQLDELLMSQQLQPQSQSPASAAAYHGAPPAFSQWPTASQEKTLLQMHAHHEKRQQELAIGLALGGDDASLRSKASRGNLNANGYPVDVKGKGRGDSVGEDSGQEAEGEGYEMHVVESPYGGGGGQDNGGYRMPAPPQAPVLHHPGYGRHHGSERSGSSGTGGSQGAAGAGYEYGGGGQGFRSVAVS